MTDQLRHLIAKVELLSEDEQNAIAALIERELIDEQHGDQYVADFDLPPYGSAAEQQLLEAVRTRVGTNLSNQGLSIAEEISQDRGA